MSTDPPTPFMDIVGIFLILDSKDRSLTSECVAPGSNIIVEVRLVLRKACR
jgi:hypothetical protein